MTLGTGSRLWEDTGNGKDSAGRWGGEAGQWPPARAVLSLSTTATIIYQPEGKKLLRSWGSHLHWLSPGIRDGDSATLYASLLFLLKCMETSHAVTSASQGPEVAGRGEASEQCVWTARSRFSPHTCRHPGLWPVSYNEWSPGGGSMCRTAGTARQGLGRLILNR